MQARVDGSENIINNLCPFLPSRALEDRGALHDTLRSSSKHRMH